MILIRGTDASVGWVKICYTKLLLRMFAHAHKWRGEKWPLINKYAPEGSLQSMLQFATCGYRWRLVFLL